ncbi:hypothetical protein SELMODRAFT_102324 [Selaginella moellendorffii]|uniref:Uncharacterized protein n=1 Tax=Selaginella moellendorffii TaxID=88036 RepID=D8RUP2_SELML|nr:hypothetical protein SELMODRAFT_102324 [Selaginella moellendorffii]
MLLLLLAFEWNLDWKHLGSPASWASERYCVRKIDGAGGHSSDFGLLGVPWCKSKIPVEWSKSELLFGLYDFLPVYATRPVQQNQWGTRLDHSFGLWFLARRLQPEIIIESGVHRGHSTWILRQAMPNASIITLSPEHPRSHESEGPFYVDAKAFYFTEENFTDFASMDWDQVLGDVVRHRFRVDKAKALVFFDDHQSHLKRVQQAQQAGFKHLVFDDNYDTGSGDEYSLRQICDQLTTGGGHSCSLSSREAEVRSQRKRAWERAVDMTELCSMSGAWWGIRGEMRDNFDKIKVPISHQDHIENYKLVQSMLQIYWEVPPLASPSLSYQRAYDPARTVAPLLGEEEREVYNRLGLDKLDEWEFSEYFQMAYARLK